ncbi:MAG: hypothetical protein DRJ26_05490, partial [Candidatus Methanomethylicota archaeon]
MLRRELRGNVGVMIISWIFFGIAMSITIPYFPLYVKALGGTDFHIALVGSASGLAALPLIIPGGYLTDIIGRKRMIIPLTWAVSVLFFAYALAPNWIALLIIRMIDSFLHFYRPALHAIIVDSLPPEVRARGIMITSIIPSIPWLIFPPIGGWLIDKYGAYGFRLAYVISGLTGIAAAALRTKFLMETLAEEKIKKKVSPFKAISEAYVDVFRVLKEAPREVMYIIIGSLLISGMSVSAYNSYAVVFVTEYSNVTREAWGWFKTIGTLASMGLSIIILPYLDRLPRKMLIIVSGLMFALSVYMLTYMKYWGAFTSVTLSSIAWSIY